MDKPNKSEPMYTTTVKMPWSLLEKLKKRQKEVEENYPLERASLSEVIRRAIYDGLQWVKNRND